MIDLSTICHECGGKLHAPSESRWPLCVRCESDPERQRQRERRRESRRCQLARVRAWRKGVKGKYYPADVARLKKKQKGLCAICDRPLILFHVDHKVPMSRGGENLPRNLQLLCPECNQAKGTLTDEEYRETLRHNTVTGGN